VREKQEDKYINVAPLPTYIR